MNIVIYYCNFANITRYVLISEYFNLNILHHPNTITWRSTLLIIILNHLTILLVIYFFFLHFTNKVKFKCTLYNCFPLEYLFNYWLARWTSPFLILFFKCRYISCDKNNKQNILVRFCQLSLPEWMYGSTIIIDKNSDYYYFYYCIPCICYGKCALGGKTFSWYTFDIAFGKCEFTVHFPPVTVNWM